MKEYILTICCPICKETTVLGSAYIAGLKVNFLL